MTDTEILNWLSVRVSYLELQGPNGERCIDYFPEAGDGTWPLTEDDVYGEEHPIVGLSLRQFVEYHAEGVPL